MASEHIEPDTASGIDVRRAIAALVTIEALGRDGRETPQELALRARSAMRLASQEILPARAGAASAAAVDGEVELVLVPLSGEDWPPRAYLVGPVAAGTLRNLLTAALTELGWEENVTLTPAEAKALRNYVHGDAFETEHIETAMRKIPEGP